jgi:hypothetical protein
MHCRKVQKISLLDKSELGVKRDRRIEKMTDWPTYEIELPLGFDTVKFKRDTQAGINNLWLLCLDKEPGIWRFKGVMRKYGSVVVFIDIFSLDQKTKSTEEVMFVTTPHYQNLSAREVADIVMKEVGGVKMYHDGEEVN